MGKPLAKANGLYWGAGTEVVQKPHVKLSTHALKRESNSLDFVAFSSEQLLRPN